jgi:hypothetical protein
MDKVKLELKLPKNKIVEYNGVEFEVIPFFSYSQQAFLIERYLEEYFTIREDTLNPSSKYNYLDAEYKLMYFIIDMNTSIDIDSLPNELCVDSYLSNKIVSEIVGFYDFKEKLSLIVEEVKEQNRLKNSVGTVLSDLIDKAYLLLDKFSEIQPESIDKAREAGLELIKKLQESSILGSEVSPVLPIIAEKKTRKKRVQ